MAELKTKETDQSPTNFLKATQPTQKREDAFTLLKMFMRITGERAILWGSSMVGFGRYHYKSERSDQEGDWPLVAFSPRKQNLTLYLMSGFKDKASLLSKLGKHKTGVGCLYINKLADVDINVLEKLIDSSYREMKKKYIGRR